MNKGEPYRATKLWNDVVRTFTTGLPVGRRRRHIRQYSDTFTAHEAITWLHFYLRNNPNFSPDVTRQQTVQLLHKLQKAGIFENINGESKAEDFKDNRNLYRFSSAVKNKLSSPPRAPLTPYNRQEKKMAPGLVGLTAYCKPDVSKVKGKPPTVAPVQRKPSALGLTQTKAITLGRTPAAPIKSEQPSRSDQSHILTVNEVEEVWKSVTLGRLQSVLSLPHVDSVVDVQTVSGKHVMHNATRIGRNGLVTSVEDSLPHWVISAMKCLAHWPQPTGYESNLPKYPGFERDVFSVVKDYFIGLETPLTSFNMYNTFMNVLVRAEYLDGMSRQVDSRRFPREVDVDRGRSPKEVDVDSGRTIKHYDPRRIPSQISINQHRSVSQSNLNINVERGNTSMRSDSSCVRSQTSLASSKVCYETAFTSANPVTRLIPKKTRCKEGIEPFCTVRLPRHTRTASQEPPAVTPTRQRGSVINLFNININKDKVSEDFVKNNNDLTYLNNNLDNRNPYATIRKHNTSSSSQLHGARSASYYQQSASDKVLNTVKAKNDAMTTSLPALGVSGLLNKKDRVDSDHTQAYCTVREMKNKRSNVRRLRSHSGGYMNLAFLENVDCSADNTVSKDDVDDTQSVSSDSSYHTALNTSRPEVWDSQHSPDKKNQPQDDDITHKEPRLVHSCSSDNLSVQSGSSLTDHVSLYGRGLRRYNSSPSKLHQITRLQSYHLGPVASQSDVCGSRFIVKALQLVCLFLAPSDRQKLHLLLHLMYKISHNPQLHLNNELPNKQLVLDTFTHCILSAEDMSEYNEQQATTVVSLLMDNYGDVMGVPQGMLEEVEGKLAVVSSLKTRCPLPGAALTYCKQVSAQEYEEQRHVLSKSALSQLLDSIVSDQHLSTKDRKKKLKLFKHAYPEIYARRFPTVDSELAAFPSQSKLPMIARRFTKLRSMRM